MVLKISSYLLSTAAVLWTSPALSFVLLSGPEEARLPASHEVPEIQFAVHPTPPPISEKDQFAAGVGSLVSDQDFWMLLIQQAMQQWNDVNGSYLRMTAVASSAAQLDKTDNIYSIVVGSTNLTSSAYAQPVTLDGVIQDCDIAVSERSSRAESLAFTLMHELGHCLGLGHNHSDYNAAMSYARNDRGLSLGLDDEAGLIYLYPAAGVPAPRELIHCGTIPGSSQSGLSWVLVLLFAFPLSLPSFRRLIKKSRFS